MHEVAALLGIATNASELAPYIAVLALGFLVAAWGQGAKSPLTVVLGMVLILLAVGAFIVEHSGGGSGSGAPGIPGS